MKSYYPYSHPDIRLTAREYDVVIALAKHALDDGLNGNRTIGATYDDDGNKVTVGYYDTDVHALLTHIEKEGY